MKKTRSSAASPAMIKVISMVGEIDRRTLFSKSAEDAVVPWSFFDAETALPSFLISDPKQQHAAMCRELLPAEIGCYASHVSVWRAFLASNARILLVFEDDVVADWAFVAKLADYDFDASQIHYLKLFNKVPVRNKVVRSSFLGRYYHLVQNLNAPFGTQAYMLTRTGAARMLENATTIRRPIDSELDRFWVHGLPSLSIVPSPVFERCSISTIGEARFLTSRPPRMAKLHRFANLCRRLFFTYFSRHSFAALPPIGKTLNENRCP